MRTALLLALVAAAAIAVAILASSLPDAPVDCTRQPGMPGGDLDCPPV